MRGAPVITEQHNRHVEGRSCAGAANARRSRVYWRQPEGWDLCCAVRQRVLWLVSSPCNSGFHLFQAQRKKRIVIIVILRYPVVSLFLPQKQYQKLSIY